MPVNRNGGLWSGGYVSLGKNGKKTYYIERIVNRQRFHVSTRCHTERAAIKQLERFESNPLNYVPEGEGDAQPVRLSSEIIQEFVLWNINIKRNSRKHAKEKGSLLFDWLEDFGSIDLRRVTIRDHIKPALEKRQVGRQHRIIALKSFYSWLRKEKHMLTHAEDPTLDVPVPQAVPEKTKRRKVVEWERVQACAAQLSDAYRDCLMLLTATGWHVTELERFIRDDESGIAYPSGGDVLAVLFVRHKIGDMTRTPLMHREHVDAAERLRARKAVPRRLNDAIKSACVAAGVEPFTLGVMRHSVLTWAIEMGATPAQASEFANHRDVRTTKRFYIDTATPTAAIPTRVLKLVKG